ncbi:MAG: Rpn family recombination-promoting nuclease/putative transposase [Geminocystis sp.]|nr:Rpn family recombination-promoting nuclease/putative transposase [Geminocystis sp.]MCS7148203.1 Rpn family recombination-promoting nuclease/putative transposase [Geminocystis sp.]MDW8117307.1 hypothetical protein [Geminocystis sp.]MDW8462312.1 hypothetical protein [Geminocystis sp.]
MAAVDEIGVEVMLEFVETILLCFPGSSREEIERMFTLDKLRHLLRGQTGRPLGGWERRRNEVIDKANPP